MSLSTICMSRGVSATECYDKRNPRKHIIDAQRTVNDRRHLSKHMIEEYGVSDVTDNNLAMCLKRMVACVPILPVAEKLMV